jgi:predicted ATPase/Tfp pilus assembly protein PilF
MPVEATTQRSIFISYRREDAAPYAGRLADALEAALGSGSVFMDVESITAGADFTQAIEEAVSAADVVLVVIGPSWGSVTAPNGARRLDEERDWVRTEVEAALVSDARVVPILVGGASMPPEAELPEPIARLARLNAFELPDTRWRDSVTDLVELIQGRTARCPSCGAENAPGATFCVTCGASLTEPEPAHSLPPALSPLVGRAEDISELVGLLGSDDVRVVTLTGPGGVGKTRLALALGAELLASFPDGVFFVDLSALADPSLVVGAIATALGLREAPGRSLTETLSDYLASRQVLLILDNFEHLLAAASDVSGLVNSAPGLSVLVTSREPLRIAGEHEVPLAPLRLPPHDADASEVLQAPAVELFVARARDLRPGFELSTDDATSVARICRRMDGLPLAIELAAARTKVLSLPALATRLEQSLGALGQGRRDASERQRTLRGAIEWSYELLSPDEQILFRRLGVFAGGWTLEAAEAVCHRGDLSTDVLDGLASLIDKSLVRAREHEDRFVMLETIRSFAADELEASGEAEEIRRQHADHFRGLAEDAEPHLARAEQKEWLDRLDSEADNIRAALRWLIGNDVEQAGRCAVSLNRFWKTRGLAREGYPLSLEILEAGEGHLELTLVARLCHEVGSLVGVLGDHDTARLHLERALSLFQESSDDAGIALTMMGLAWLSLLEGDLERAEQLARRATELARAADDQALYGRALFIEATVSMDREDREFTKERFQQSLAVRQDAGDRTGVSSVLSNLGAMYLEDHQPAEARTLLERGLRLASEIGDVDGLSRTTVNLGFVSLLQGRTKEATSWFRDSLAGAEKTGARYVTVYVIEGLACAAVTQGRSSDAARLFGLAEALRMEMGVPRTRGEDELYATYLDKARREIGPEEWTRLTSQAETDRDPLALRRLLADQIALAAQG